MPNLAPKEFIEETFEDLKNHLDNYDIQLNKVGFAGYLINLLAHIQYDSKQYYDSLFNESFVALSQHFNNLYMHGSIYGYTIPLATPSTATGSFTFDFNNLPKESNVNKRVVTFNNISFMYDNVNFQTNTVYKFIEENNYNYYVIVYLEDGTINYIPSSTSNIIAPFFNVKQYTKTTQSFKLPNYQFGSYYPYKLNITDDNFLFNLEVYVKQPKVTDYISNLGESFDIKSIKYLENKFSKTCFIKTLSPYNYVLEFGSGIRGLYIPNSDITLVKYLTIAENAHFTTSKVLKSNQTTKAEILVNDKTLRSISNKYLTINFDYSEGGKNSPTGDELRKDVINHIQSKEFLIDKKDYLNLTELKDTEYTYSFRKSDIYRNDFYLHQVINNELEIPIKSNCINIPSININNSVQNFTATQIISSDGELEHSNIYNYSIFASDSFHISQITNHDSIELSDPNNSIELTWDEYPNAINYLIIVENNGNFRYFTVTSNSFIDLGQESNYINNYIYSFDSDGLPNISWENSYVFFPEINNFKSPFVYKYNSNMRWFEGNLFYQDFIVLFSRTLRENTDYTIPYFHLRVLYNFDILTTTLYTISAQNSSDYDLYITIPKLNIVDQKSIRPIGESGQNICYIEIPILLDENIIVEIDICLKDTTEIVAKFATNEFKQLQSIKDQIKILSYIDQFDDEYLLSIPIIEKDYYIDNKDSVDLLLINNIYQTNIKGRRFPNDEVQFRFLNTDIIQDFALRNSTVQKYDFNLQLPLKFKVDIIYNSQYLDSNPINLVDEKEKIYFDIATKLRQDYTGNEITYYNSQLVDFIHSNRPYIKSVKVTIYDYNDVEISNGIESLDEMTIMENIQKEVVDLSQSKIQILNYFPHYFYWDINNLEINYSF